MKKILMFAAIAALFSFMSCQKEDNPAKEEAKDLVFTATIDGGTKTTVDAANAKVAWVTGDQVAISDNASHTATYQVSAIDTQGKATFTKVSGDVLSSAPFTATYGSAPAASQTYSATAPALPMSATSSTTSLNFNVTCGLLELTLTQAGESIKSIKVSDNATTPNTYTLNCENGGSGVSIASGAKFYIALPAGTYTSFIFSNALGFGCVKSPSIKITANIIKPVTSSSLSFTSPIYPESGTPGVKIGDIWWAPVNCGYSKSKPNGLFYQWGRKYGQSTTVTPEFITTQASSMAEGNRSEYKDKFYIRYQSWFSGSTVSDTWLSEYDPCPAGWRVPTKEELTNLTASPREWKTGSTSGETGYLFGTSPNQVFFSASGQRSRESGSVISESTSGYYWSSSPDSWYAGAKYLYFSMGNAAVGQDYRSFGCSVRCVK